MDRYWRVWRLLLDVWLTIFGTWMLFHETQAARPRLIVIGAGIVVISGPATIRQVAERFFGGTK